MSGLQVIWQALQDMRERGYGYIWSNLLFVVLCLPIITAPAAFSALMYTGYTRYTNRHEAELEAFWGAFRQNRWRAFLWGLGHLIFGVVHLTNVLFYSGSPGIVTNTLRAMWFIIGIIWIGVIFFTWPLYYEMETPSLMSATRNAILMVLQNPMFTITLVVSMFLISVISTVFIVSWVLLTWGVFAAIGNAAVYDRLQHDKVSSLTN